MIDPANVLTPTDTIIILSFWVACLSPFLTRYLPDRWAGAIGIAIIILSWLTWMLFFDGIGYFGPAIACSSWWVLARKRAVN